MGEPIDYEAGKFDEETAELIEMAAFYEIGDFARPTQGDGKPAWLRAYLDKPNDREPIDWQGYDE